MTPTPLRLTAALALVAASATACSSNVADATGSTGESLSVLVHLPRALGGADRQTRLTPHTSPKTVFPTGLRVTPRKAGGGGIKAQGNPAGPLPTTIDISSFAPTPGNQGQTGSCAAWATGYSSMGWWAAKSGIGGAPFAPMFLYAQEVQGACDQGTSIEGNMDILQQQGIDTAADYEPMQQNLDCATQPNAQNQANAAKHKISGYQQLDFSSGPRQAIEQMLAAGYPVVLGIMAYPELMNATAQDYLIGPPQPGETLYGGHAITAFKYDENGVWILNSWSAQWGLQGWGELSWAFIEGSMNGQANVMDAAAITGVVGGGDPQPTPDPNPAPPPDPTPQPSGGPQVGFASPADGSTVSPGDTVNIVVNASDPSAGITGATLDWESPAGSAQFILADLGNGQWGGALQLSPQAVSGPRTLTVTITDASGQSAAATESLQVP